MGETRSSRKTEHSFGHNKLEAFFTNGFPQQYYHPGCWWKDIPNHSEDTNKAARQSASQDVWAPQLPQPLPSLNSRDEGRRLLPRSRPSGVRGHSRIPSSQCQDPPYWRPHHDCESFSRTIGHRPRGPTCFQRVICNNEE